MSKEWQEKSLNKQIEDLTLGIQELKKNSDEYYSIKHQKNVEKQGTVETKPNEIVEYTFYNIENKSNIYLEQFKWIDYIPTDYIRLETMTTGIWNQDLKHDVYYKTNKSGEYVLFKEDLDTKENYNLDFREIQLDNDEYIIEIYFDFGKVEVGFKEDVKPTMKCRTLDNLQNNVTFTNKTKTVGIYNYKSD